MKTPIHQSDRINHLARSAVVALLAGSLTIATGFAQSSTGGSSETGSAAGTGTTGSGSSTERSGWGSESGTTGAATDATNSDRRMSGTSASDTSASNSVKRSEKKFLTKVSKSTPREIAMAQLAVERASNPQVKSYAQQIISDHQQMSQELVQLAQSKGVELENQAQLTSTGGGHGAGHSGTTTASTDSGTRSGTDSDATGLSGTSTAGSAGMTASTGATGTSGSSTHAVSEDITSDRHYRKLSKKSGAEFDREFVSTMVDQHKKDLKLFQEQAEDAEDSAIRSFASQHAPVLQGHLDRAQTLSQSVAE
jgi:predicted outer membrane protein